MKVLLTIAALLLPVTVTAEEYLPTPYTAEQIRDAWVEGFEVVTRTRSAAGETYSLTRVLEWSEDGFSMSEVEVDETGRPQSGSEVTRYDGTWEELRLHARFPAARANRERSEVDSPLGRLQGWLYVVEGERGVTEFFFADNTPGPPVVYRQQGGGESGFVAEQISRRVVTD